MALGECSSRSPKAGGRDGTLDFGHRLSGNQGKATACAQEWGVLVFYCIYKFHIYKIKLPEQLQNKFLSNQRRFVGETCVSYPSLGSASERT